MMARRYLLALAVALVLIVESRNTSACGAVTSRDDTHVPSPSVETSVILYDSQKGFEHLIREVTFRGTKSRFGMVIPVPSKPEVAAVKKTPFSFLEELSAGRVPASAAFDPLGVVGGSVTEVQKDQLGPLALTVLAASDAGGLRAWLASNGLRLPPQMSPWLARYVALGFYYVVLRVEPSDADDRLHSVTLRISFATSAPFYPYHEPRWTSLPDATERVLSVWVISDQRFVPMALRQLDDATVWQRPWIERYPVDDRNRVIAAQVAGNSTELRGDALRVARAGPFRPEAPTFFGFPEDVAKLLPGGPAQLSVQYFQDQKTSHAGWGDVVLAPERATAQPLDVAVVEKWKRIAEAPPQGATPPPGFEEWFSGKANWDALPLVVADPGAQFDEMRLERLKRGVGLDIAERSRGPEISFGPAIVKGGGFPNTAGVVASFTGTSLRRCLRKVDRNNPSLTGSIMLVLELDAKGGVTKVSPNPFGKLPAQLIDCVAKELAKAKFPAPGGPKVTVRFKVTLRGAAP